MTPSATRPTNVRWIVLAATLVVGFIAYIERLNISVAGEGMKAELGFDDRQLGWIYGAFALGYALFQIPGGFLGERWGFRRTVTVTAALWGVLTLLCGLMPGSVLGSSATIVGGLIVLRFAMGVLHAPAFPIFGGIYANWFPVGKWALPNALGSAANNLGAVCTAPFVAFLMATHGWRAAFYATAPLAFVAAAVWWWAARDHPHEHARVNAAERALIGERSAKAETRPTLRVCLRLLRNRETLLLALAYLCMNYVFYIFFSWLYTYLIEERQFTLLQGGLYAALPWFGAAAGATLGGAICDPLCQRIGPRWGCRIPAITGLVLAAALLFGGALATNPLVAIVMLSLCFACVEVTEGPFWSAQTYVAGPHTATATGILNTGGNLGGVVCAPMIPLLVHYFDWIPALASGSVVALISAALWLFIRADRPAQT